MSNRLKDEPSRYLQQHKDNPVDWRPWGAEAFEEARRLDKPLFVSIGYSSCHWCHVMAHESFEDDDTANLINEYYVPVKVDREEYPDVDGYYISFLTQLTGQAGWPLNVFLNPAGAPFYGTTYHPAKRLRGLLTYVHEEYRKNEAIRTQQINTSFSQRPIRPAEAEAALRSMELSAPGTNSGPQFPQGLYLTLAKRHGDTDMVSSELRNLLLKGLFDHIEGGWFRYSVDPQWKVPHFEKMLYDQATLLSLCAEAHDLEPDLCSYAIAKTVSWLTDRMKLSNGLYGSATDADTDEGEGIYYTFDEISSQGEVELFRLTDCGVHEGRHLPWLDLDVYRKDPDAAEQIIRRHAAARSRHTAPGLDRKAVFSWNAFLCYGLYRCAAALKDTSVRLLADGLLQALRQRMDHNAPHAAYETGEGRGHGYLQNYSSYLLALSEASQNEPSLRKEADGVLQAIDRRFVEEDFLWHTDVREFESQSLWQDTPFPSGGSMLLNALVSLDRCDHHLVGKLFTNISTVAAEHPVFFSYWCHGFTRYFERQ